MGIFDAIHVSEGALAVHRFRSEVAAENIANIHTPGYGRREVDLQASDFQSTLEGVSNAGSPKGANTVGGLDATDGVVHVAGVRNVGSGKYDERQRALMATTDMMRAKSAFDMNVRAATLLKSMALSSLEIGRGS
jgi:flagellar basal body rod protein FlgC